jgi:hypothetical protein
MVLKPGLSMNDRSRCRGNYAGPSPIGRGETPARQRVNCAEKPDEGLGFLGRPKPGIVFGRVLPFTNSFRTGTIVLKEFLQKNQTAILALTEQKARELAGDHPSSELLRKGLPRFYQQVIEVIGAAGSSAVPPAKDVKAIARAADRGDEPAMATAAGQPGEAELARSAGLHGSEMLRLGYTLSHVVHAYGAMCQAITEKVAEKDAFINANEFHALNQCLDVAIAGAVTEFQSRKDSDDVGSDVTNEMRTTLVRAKVAFEAIKNGTVGIGGSTARTLENSLGQLERLVNQSLVRRDAAHRPEKP